MKEIASLSDGLNDMSAKEAKQVEIIESLEKELIDAKLEIETSKGAVEEEKNKQQEVIDNLNAKYDILVEEKNCVEASRVYQHSEHERKYGELEAKKTLVDMQLKEALEEKDILIESHTSKVEEMNLELQEKVKSIDFRRFIDRL